MEIVENYQGKFDELDYEKERKIEGVETGEDADHESLRVLKYILQKSAKCKLVQDGWTTWK